MYMKVLTRIATLSFLMGMSATVSLPAHAQIDRVVAFGDSLTDNGNVFAATGGIVPRSPYFNGRFSNGKVYAEILAASLNVNLDDKAFGGANTDTTNTGSNALITLPGMRSEVDNYITAAGSGSLDSSALYILFGGANDYLYSGQTNPLVPVANLTTEVTLLANKGAKNFVVFNLPNLGNLPSTLGNATVSANLNLLTAAHNSALSTSLLSLQQSRPALKVTLFDVNSLVNQIIGNPGGFGFTDVTHNYITNSGGNPAYVSGTDPNAPGYFFWDEIHPTTAVHSIIAQRLLTTVAPEPGTFVLAVVGIAAIGIRRRSFRPTK